MADLDIDMERALAPLLERPLADPEPLPQLERRAARGRHRRWMARLGLATAAAATVVALVVWLPDSADQVVRTTPPADAPSEPPAVPRRDPLWDPPEVSSIVVEGEEWHIVAGVSGEGDFCSGLRHREMTSFGCSDGLPLEPREVLTAALPQDMRGRRAGEVLPPWEPRFIYGMATKDVATVRIELRSGGRAEAPVTRSDAGLPMSFYMVALPAGAEIEAVVALDTAGREIGRLRSPFWWETLPPPPCGPQPPPDGGPCLPPAPALPGASSVTEERTHPSEGGD